MKQLLCLLLTLLFLTAAQAQEIVFQFTAGGGLYDDPTDVIKTSDGGYALFGTSTSGISGDKSEDSLGMFDYWVVRTDAEGNVVWDRTLGGSAQDYAAKIRQTPDGGFILFGDSESNSSLTKSENSLGLYDYWVVKLDANGNIVWDETIGGTNNDKAESMVMNPDGTFVIAGWSASSISPDKTEHSVNVDYWILKLDQNANVIWQNTITAINGDFFPKIVALTDGGYLVAGNSQSDSGYDKTEDCRGQADYWVLKLDSLGAVEWDKTYGGSGMEWIAEAKEDITGGYMILGSSDSYISGDKTSNTHGDKDYWIIKTDATGNIVWQTDLGTSKFEKAENILQTPDSMWIVTGISRSSVSQDKTVPSKGYNDWWLIQIDGAGNILWQKDIGTMYYDLLQSSELTSDGNLLLSGNGPGIISGDKIHKGKGESDFWVLELSLDYNLASGKVFFDFNSNASIDSSDGTLPGMMIKESIQNQISLCHANGTYYLTLDDTGTLDMSCVAPNYYNSIPVSHTAHFTGMNQSYSQKDFALQPAGNFNDLCVSLTPTANFRPGMLSGYKIYYNNVGTTTLAPVVVFYPDTNITFQSANPAPTSVTSDSIVWNLPLLSPYQSGNIQVDINVSVIPIGTVIHSSAIILPIIGDADPACNYAESNAEVTGAVDPNDISVDRDSIFNFELIAPPYLEYLIRFQNTGNDTAFHVAVLNNIPEELDLATFQVTAVSHPFDVDFIQNPRLLEFHFPNILLPDSNVNEAASHGFIRYRIKPRSTLIAGDSINNYAAIYFDFNDPVITNTAITEVVLPTGIEDPAAAPATAALLLYPNPAADRITIQYSREKGTAAGAAAAAVKIEIFNTIGDVVKEVRMYPNAKGSLEMGVSGLPDGMYLVRVRDEQGGSVAQGRFVKM